MRGRDSDFVRVQTESVTSNQGVLKGVKIVRGPSKTRIWLRVLKSTIVEGEGC